MSDTPDTLMVTQRPLSLVEKLAALTAWGVAGGLFLTVGWSAMRPDDPLGAVSVLTRQGRAAMLCQAAMLAAFTGGLATLLVGRRLIDVGTLAAALGLALVSLRGETAAYLYTQGPSASSIERSAVLVFVVESIGWFLVIVSAVIVSALVTRWCHGSSAAHDTTESAAPPMLAGFDIPRVASRWFAVPSSDQTAVATGIKHALIGTGVGLAMLTLLSTGSGSRAIQHGQVCFIVAAASFVACHVAHRVVPVRSLLWSLLSIVLMAIAAYLWAALSAPERHPPGVPASHFSRILPLQFISIGSAVAVLTLWSVASGGMPRSTPPPSERR